MAALRTALALVALPAALLVLAPAGIALALLGVRARPLHRLYVAFGRIAMAVGGTPLHVRGREHARAGCSYVVVSNHESAWDPLALLAALPGLSLRFIVKAPIMRIPLLGRALRVSGNVLVVRTDTAADVRRIEAHMARRDPDVSVLFFGEGTRSRDGALHAFKKGPFATAIAHGLPVLPVAVAGTFRIWPKGRLALQPGPVAIEIGAPIPVEGLRHEDRDALRARVFEAVRELRARARARVRELGVEPGGVDA